MGRGRFYYTRTSTASPILTLETQLASKGVHNRQAFRAVPSHAARDRAGHPLDQHRLGRLRFRTPNRRDVLLLSIKRPVLAAWRYGLGRSVAFTSDAKAKWGVLWLKWTSTTSSSARCCAGVCDAQRREVVASVVHRDGRGEIQLERWTKKATSSISSRPIRRGPAGQDADVLPLTQVGPGRYRARSRPRPGAYLVGVSERKDQKLIGSRWRVGRPVLAGAPRPGGERGAHSRPRDGHRGGAADGAGTGVHPNRKKAQVRVAPGLSAGPALLLFLPGHRASPLLGAGRRARGASSGTASAGLDGSGRAPRAVRARRGGALRRARTATVSGASRTDRTTTRVGEE